MFLVDTSVWIDFLRKRDTREVQWLQKILDRAYPFGLTPQIYQEILQGADSAQSFDRLVKFFSTQIFYLPKDPVESAGEAARLYNLARRQGLTIRSTVDCLIARIALEHDLFLLHNDRDFEFLQVVEPTLRLYRGDLTANPMTSSVHEPANPPYDPHL